jgi:hypothetical protein
VCYRAPGHAAGAARAASTHALTRATRRCPVRHRQRLAEMGVEFIQESESGKDFSRVQNGEVVILPAFGASVHEMKLLNDRGVQIVDTTCPWVSKARVARPTPRVFVRRVRFCARRAPRRAAAPVPHARTHACTLCTHVRSRVQPPPALPAPGVERR